MHEIEPTYRADVEIDFWEFGFLGGHIITDQFQAFGVTFSDQMRWLRRVQQRRGARGATLANFDRKQTINTDNPFSIKFDYLVDEVTFGLTAPNVVTRVTALLRGRQVGFFETTVDHDPVQNNFFGFEGFRLDEVLIDFGNGGFGTTFDTLHFNHALNQRGDKIASGVPAVRYRSLFDDPPAVPAAPETAGGVAGISASGMTSANPVGQVSSVTAVPLPAPAWLLLAGIGGLGWLGRRRRRS